LRSLTLAIVNDNNVEIQGVKKFD